MNNYTFSDREFDNFYKHIATQRPGESNRGGGRRVIGESLRSVVEAEKAMHIVFYFSKKFRREGRIEQAEVAERLLFNLRTDVLMKREKLFIPDEKLGEELVQGRLSKTMRAVCYCLQSVAKGKPNEMARAVFSM